MKKTKRFLALAFMICIIAAFSGMASAAVINDIQGHWAQATIEKWLNKGLISGYSDSTVKPDNQITRAEFIVLVNRATAKTYQNQICGYGDVAANDWYYQDVAIAQAAGYIGGYPDNTLRPDQAISRQEVAVIISKLTGSQNENIDYTKSLLDTSDIPDWSRGSINNVLGKKIMNGYLNGTFMPLKNISRAEALIVLDNLLKSTEKNTPAENPTDHKNFNDGGNNSGNNNRTNDRTNNQLIYDDKDNDGLFDQFEELLGTDPQSADSDKDGLPDGYEKQVVGSDPTTADTDGDGIFDADEDPDGDSLDNLDEYLLETNPLSDDSDIDNLNDFDEITIYKTDPINQDTDGDRFTDGNEILYGTDPLNPDSNGNGVKDGDEAFEVSVIVSDIESDGVVDPSVVLNLEGRNIDSVSISNVGSANPYLRPGLPGYIGVPYDFETSAPFSNATLTFSYDAESLNGPDFEPAIYYFNQATTMLELLPNQSVDLLNGQVSVEVNHFSTYILLNKIAFDEVWEKEMKPPIDGEPQNIEIVIGFAIDSSGSMSWNDPGGLRKQTAQEFVDKLDDNDKAAVIDFDYYATVRSHLTSDKSLIKSAIGLIDSNGGTSLSAGMTAAINEIKDDPSKIKYIIMLTDGVGDYDSSLTQQAIDLGIVVYTIGLGYDIDQALLQQIATATGGKYYHADTSDDLSNIFDQTSQETIELGTFTDKDTLSDYHEKRGMKTKPNLWIYTDPYDEDSDNDDLLDSEEMIYQADGTFLMVSDPNLADTDNDGLLDKEDPEPMVYNITDRTLAMAAELSYTNLQSSIGDHVRDYGQVPLSEFLIVYANNSNWSTLNDFFDTGLGSVAIKISRPGKRDAVIYAIRGTEFDDNAIRDGLTDFFLGLGTDTVQSNAGAVEYALLAKYYPNSDFFIAGHSLGGRIVQDVLYKVYDANDGIFGLFKSNIQTPIHSATFNALGYNKAQFFSKWLFKQSNANDIRGKLKNYYARNDFVGEGLGNSGLFCRLGTDVGPWTAVNADKEPIVDDNLWGYAPAAVHSVEWFFYNDKFQYSDLTKY